MRAHLQMAGLALAALAIVWSGPSGAAKVTKSAEVQQTGMLTVANTLDYAPFEYLDADGKQTGIIIELAGEVAKLVGAKLDVARTPFPSMIPGLAPAVSRSLGRLSPPRRSGSSRSISSCS